MKEQTTTADMPVELRPCGHMVNLISRRSDDSLGGPAKWYTDFHVMTCPHCRTALQGLRQLHREIGVLATIPVDPSLKLDESDWKKIECSIEAGVTDN
jgi:hypothetical protein